MFRCTRLKTEDVCYADIVLCQITSLHPLEIETRAFGPVSLKRIHFYVTCSIGYNFQGRFD